MEINDKSIKVNAVEFIDNEKFKWHIKEDICDYTICDIVKKMKLQSLLKAEDLDLIVWTNIFVKILFEIVFHNLVTSSHYNITIISSFK